MGHMILDQRPKDLPASVWQKIVRIDGHKKQWIGGVKTWPPGIRKAKKIGVCYIYRRIYTN